MDAYRKVLVLHLAEHLFEVKLNGLHDENDDNDCDRTQDVCVLPKK